MRTVRFFLAGHVGPNIIQLDWNPEHTDGPNSAFYGNFSSSSLHEELESKKFMEVLGEYISSGKVLRIKSAHTCHYIQVSRDLQDGRYLLKATGSDLNEQSTFEFSREGFAVFAIQSQEEPKQYLNVRYRNSRKD